MKHIKGKILVLMGFLLVALPAQGVKELTRGKISQSGLLLNFWQALQISAGQQTNNFILLDELFDPIGPDQINIQLNSRYPYPGTPNGVFPLEYAIIMHNVDLANDLIERGAVIDNLNNDHLLWLLQHQPTPADRAWIVSKIQNKEFANNLAINMVINSNESKENKIAFITSILTGYASLFKPWCIEGLKFLQTLLANPTYANITNTNTLFRAPDQGGLLSAAIADGFIDFAYWLAGHGADINDPFASIPPIRQLIVNMCERQTLTNDQFANCTALLILMLLKGADVNMPGKDGLNTLMAIKNCADLHRQQNNQMMLTRCNLTILTINKYHKNN